jgi:hypothetical protein
MKKISLTVPTNLMMQQLLDFFSGISRSEPPLHSSAVELVRQRQVR